MKRLKFISELGFIRNNSKRVLAREKMSKSSSKKRPPRAYVYGRVHGPGKKHEHEIVNMVDDMLQEELDGLDLTGLPITDDHPDDGKLVSDQPGKVRGEILKTFNCADGSKNILAAIDTDTYSGCRTVAGIMNGDIGLSLGHVYREVRTETGEFVERSFTGDHVALCRSPRRKGCKLIAAGRHASYLEKDQHKTATSNEPLQDTEVVVNASRASVLPTAPTFYSSDSASSAVTGNMNGNSNTNQGQTPMPMDTTSNQGGNTGNEKPDLFPNTLRNQMNDTSKASPTDDMTQEQRDLLDLGAEFDSHRAEWREKEKEYQRKLKEADRIIEEKDKQAKAEFEAKKAELERELSATADAWLMQIENLNDGKKNGITKKMVMESLLPPSTQTTEDLKFAENRHKIFQGTVAASSRQHELMMENEKLRAHFFDGGAGTAGEEQTRKRARIEGFGAVGSTRTSSSSSNQSQSVGRPSYTFPTDVPTSYVGPNGAFQSSKSAYQRLQSLREAKNGKQVQRYDSPPKGWRGKA